MLQASWRVDRQIGRRRLAWRWALWYVVQWQCWAAGLALIGVVGFGWFVAGFAQSGQRAIQISTQQAGGAARVESAPSSELEQQKQESPLETDVPSEPISLVMTPTLEHQASHPPQLRPSTVDLFFPEPSLELRFDQRLYSKEI